MRIFRSPMSLFPLCVLIFIASALFLSGVQSQGLLLWGSRRLRLWHIIIAANPTLWIVSVLAMFEDWRKTLGSGTRAVWMELRVAVVFAALMILLPSLLAFLIPRAGFPVVFEHSDELLLVPTSADRYFTRVLLWSAVVMLHLSGMFGVHAQLLSQFQQPFSRQEAPDAERLAEEVQRYQQLRSRLGRFLGFAAANIGAAILAFSSMNILLSETAPDLFEWFPKGAAMSYGAYYTWLLAIIYLPIRKTLSDVGQGLADELIQQSRVPRLHWKQWLEERQALHTYLGLQGSALQEFQQALFVLSPLLAGLSSLTLGA